MTTKKSKQNPSLIITGDVKPAPIRFEFSGTFGCDSRFITPYFQRMLQDGKKVPLTLQAYMYVDYLTGKLIVDCDGEGEYTPQDIDEAAELARLSGAGTVTAPSQKIKREK